MPKTKTTRAPAVPSFLNPLPHEELVNKIKDISDRSKIRVTWRPKTVVGRQRLTPVSSTAWIISEGTVIGPLPDKPDAVCVEWHSTNTKQLGRFGELPSADMEVAELINVTPHTGAGARRIAECKQSTALYSTQHIAQLGQTVQRLEGSTKELQQSSMKTQHTLEQILRLLGAQVGEGTATPQEEDSPASPASPLRTEPTDAELDAELLCRGAGLSCKGCLSFVCLGGISKAKRAEFLDALRVRSTEGGLVDWLIGHSFVKPKPSVCGHTKSPKKGETDKPSGPRCNCESLTFKFTARSCHYICNESKCRIQQRAAIYPDQAHITGLLLFIVEIVAGAARVSTGANMRNISPATVQEWTDTLCDAAIVFNSLRFTAGDGLKWQNAQWDETFWGQRKYNRGARSRQSGILTFVGGVDVVKTPKNKCRIIDGFIAAAPAKSREEQIDLVLAATEAGATVTTDSAPMYKGLDAAGRVHKVVNHKRMFVNSEGDHTNAVEGFWSVLKKHLKLWFGNQSSDNSKVAKRFHLAAFVANSRFAGFDEAPALLMLLRFWNDVRRVGPLLAKDILESATAAFSFPSEKELEDFAPDEDPAPTVARAAPTNTASPELVGTLTENVVVVEEEAAEGRGDPEDAEAGEDAAEAGEDAAADDDDDDDDEEAEEEEDGEDDEEADGEEDDEVDHEADEYGEAVDDDYEAADGNYDDEQADASDDDMELVPRPQKKQHRAEGRGVTWREPISDVGPQGPNRERLMTSTPRTPPRTRSGRLGPASQYVRASVVPPHLLPTQDVSTAAA